MFFRCFTFDFFHVILTQHYFFIFFNILWYFVFSLHYIFEYTVIFIKIQHATITLYNITTLCDIFNTIYFFVGLQDIWHVMHKTGVIFPETDVLSVLQISYLSPFLPRPSYFSHHNSNQVRSVKLNTSSQSVTSLLREWGQYANGVFFN